MTFRQLCQRLAATYPEGEARAVVFVLLEEAFGLSQTDVLVGRLDSLSTGQLERLEAMMRRLETGEPVQYVVGSAEFCGFTFRVTPGVLIPRPETEQLVDWVAADILTAPSDTPVRILDIGTGSGCIALSLAHRLPHAQVHAWDISDEALTIARDSACRLGLDVMFAHRDALSLDTYIPTSTDDCFDIIVSNPPYICQSEKVDMSPNVLDHEPHQALFVPDNDPLLFYRSIAEGALRLLRLGGALYFEINRAYGDEVCHMLESLGYTDVQLRQDFMGEDRMVKSLKIKD